MKKILLLLLLCIPFMLLSNVVVASTDDDDDDISVIEIDDVLGDLPICRNVGVILDEGSELLEVIFEKPVGEVSVIVKNDMGQLVSRSTYNTELEPVKYISTPIAPGNYTITILGDGYEGQGSYGIMDDYSEF